MKVSQKIIFSLIILLYLFCEQGITRLLNIAPISVINPRDSGAQHVYAGVRMDYSGTSSFDPDGGSITGYWWYIDGQEVGTSSTLSYTFSLDKTETSRKVYLKLKVKDDEGSVDEYGFEVAISRKPQSYYYLKDHLGNIRVTVDEDGNSVAWNDYYPFGLQMPQRSMNNALSNNIYKFSGKELDDEKKPPYAVFEVRIISKGFDDGNSAAFYINGSYVSRSYLRGYNLTVVDSDGNVLENRRFDTYGSDTDSDEMADFINGLNDGLYVLVAVKDEASHRMTDAGYQALESIGSSQCRFIKYRDSYGFFGRKGETYCDLEKHFPRYNGHVDETSSDVGKGIDIYYFGARYYDPEIGRFLTIDRFADKYPSMTPYQYAANNPVLFIDVNGDSLGLFDKPGVSVSVSGEAKLGVKAEAKAGPVEVGVNLTAVEGTVAVSSDGTVSATGKAGTVGFKAGVGNAKVEANGDVVTGKVSVGSNGVSADGTIGSGTVKLQYGAVNASAKGSILPQAGSVTVGTDNTGVNISNFDISFSVSAGPLKGQVYFNPVLSGAQAGAIAIHTARAKAGTNKYPAGPATILLNKLLGN
jgi:RHS repeat-associated protein